MASMDKDTFREELETALTHLRDVVRLRTMDLAAALLPDLSHVERGWGLSRYLLSAIEELKPHRADRDYWVRRRYELLTLRYANSLSVADICAEVAIGERHCYRQLQRALDELAEHIWATKLEPDATSSPEPKPPGGCSMQALLERETEQLQSGAQRAHLGQVLEAVYQLVAPVATRRGTICSLRLADNTPLVCIAPEILRQFLLGLLGSLITLPNIRRLEIASRALDGLSAISARVEGSFSADMRRDLAQSGPLVESLSGLARMQGIEMVQATLEPRVIRYTFVFPTAGDRTVLVVDDNADVRLLLRRYLVEGGYTPLLAEGGESGLRLARSAQLYAIILDLMMSQEDGWDVLQALSHDPLTSGIPVVVCSVLNQRELALLLGARGFVQKPVMCEHLLATLEDLAEPPD